MFVSLTLHLVFDGAQLLPRRLQAVAQIFLDPLHYDFSTLFTFLKCSELRLTLGTMDPFGSTFCTLPGQRLVSHLLIFGSLPEELVQLGDLLVDLVPREDLVLELELARLLLVIRGLGTTGLCQPIFERPYLQDVNVCTLNVCKCAQFCTQYVYKSDSLI